MSTRPEQTEPVLVDSSELSVTVSSDRPEWSELLALDSATIFHDPRWGELMDEVYGNRSYYLTARRSGKVVAALQLVHQKSLLFGSRLTSLPYFDAAGILGSDADADAEAIPALIAASKKLLSELKADSVEIRLAEVLDQSLPTRTDKVTMRLSLPDDPDQAWSNLKAKVRNQVRKAETAGMVCQQGRLELVSQFHRLYAENMRNLGSPPHSRRFFEAIFDKFGDSSRVFVVSNSAGKPVAASFTLEDRHCLCVPWAASDFKFRSDCPNMLLYWEMIKQACLHPSRCFDFGRGTRDGGTHRFKRQWGSQEIPLYWQYLLEPGQEMPSIRPDSPKYRLMVTCWQKLPVSIVKLLGPRIISKLS